MSKRDKLRKKLRNNPKSANKQDIITLLTQFGFVLDRIVGSHHVFILSRDDQIYRIVIPMHRNTVKVVYVRQALQAIDELFPEEDVDGSENE